MLYGSNVSNFIEKSIFRLLSIYLCFKAVVILESLRWRKRNVLANLVKTTCRAFKKLAMVSILDIDTGRFSYAYYQV